MGYVVFGSSTIVYSLFLLGRLLCSYGRLSKTSSRVVRSGLTRAADKGVWVLTQTLPDHLGVEISTASAIGWIKFPHRRMPKDYEVCQGHPVPVGQGCQTCSIGFTTFIPRQGILYRRGVRSGALPPPRFARQTRAVEATFHPRSCSFAGPAVVGRFSLLLVRQRCATVAFSTDTSNLDRYKFRARVQVSHASRKAFGEWWSLPEKMQWHITMKELVTVRRGILRFADDLRGHTVCL